jgi:serine phosphatase RsbU (regulator of sigma subunit)
VTALHAVYDQPNQVLSWARGGLPYPILVRGGRATHVVSRGILLGAMEEVCFERVDFQLCPGDTVLFYTDGLESLLCEPASSACSGQLAKTAWYKSLGHEPVGELLAQVAERRGRIRPGDRFLDDITIVALEVTD